MRTNIPAKVEVTCDACLKLCENDRLGTVLHLNRSALDFQGCAVGPGGFKYDLCDVCSNRIAEGIEKLIKEIRT